jgi:hypothetical protein
MVRTRILQRRVGKGPKAQRLLLDTGGLFRLERSQRKKPTLFFLAFPYAGMDVGGPKGVTRVVLVSLAMAGVNGRLARGNDLCNRIE